MGWIAAVALVGGVISAVLLALEVMRRPQQRRVMAFAWPMTGLYLGPLAVWAYWKAPRALLEVLPCTAACALVDLIGELFIFALGWTSIGPEVWGDYAKDFTLSDLFGLVCEYVAAMGVLRFGTRESLTAVARANTALFVAFELGMIAWRAFTHFGLHLWLRPDELAFWFMLQIGMGVGLAIACLVRSVYAPAA